MCVVNRASLPFIYPLALSVDTHVYIPYTHVTSVHAELHFAADFLFSRSSPISLEDRCIVEEKMATVHLPHNESVDKTSRHKELDWTCSDQLELIKILLHVMPIKHH